MTKHTLSVLVENKPGVLARVAGLFSRRGLQHRLARGRGDRAPRGLPDHDRGQRRRLAAGAGHQAAQQAGQRAEDRRAGVGAPRSSASCCWSRYGPTVHCGHRCWRRWQLFRARVVDVSPDALTIEATGTAEKLDALLRDLEPYGIKEMVQSGMVAIGRGSRSITAPVLRAAS